MSTANRVPCSQEHTIPQSQPCLQWRTYTFQCAGARELVSDTAPAVAACTSHPVQDRFVSLPFSPPTHATHSNYRQRALPFPLPAPQRDRRDEGEKPTPPTVPPYPPCFLDPGPLQNTAYGFPLLGINHKG